MGTKISDMTLTGSAPADSEIVIAYSGQNYKINPSALREASGGATFNSGWVNTDGTTTVADGATLTFDHNLGTTDIIFSIFVASDASGTDAREADMMVGDSSTTFGAFPQSITNTSTTIQLGSGGFITLDSSGVDSSLSFSGKYIKVIVSSASGGPRAYVAFDGTAANVTNSITNSFNISSITDNQVGQYTVNFSNPVENPVAVHDNGPRSDGFPILYSDLYNVGSGSIKIALGSSNVWYDSAYISLVVF